MAQTLPAAADQTVVYEDFYESTLAQDVGTSDTQIFPTTLPMSASGFLVMDPDGDTPEIIFYNVVGPTYVQVPSSTNGEGRGVFNTSPGEYDEGTKIGMYSIAAFFEMLATGRGIRDGAIEARHFSAGLDPNQWVGTGETWNYGGHNGQKESYYVVAGDLTSKYSPGMKLRMPRIGAVSTRSADFESTSSQYAGRAGGSLTGVAFGDDYTCEAWIKLESYPASPSTYAPIVSRFSTGSGGWTLFLNPFGQIVIQGQNGGSNWRNFTSTQTVPLSEWVHVAATEDLSGVLGTTYLNGVSIQNATLTGGTPPTTVTQTGDLRIGSWNTGTEYFDGLISDVRVWSTVRSAAQIRDNLGKNLVGNEAGLVGYWKLDNSFNDSTANANHLTPAGGASAATVDPTFKTTEYGIITKVEHAAGNTTITVFTGVDHVAPQENLTGVAYTSSRAPFGFPAAEDKWRVQTINMATITVPFSGTSTFTASKHRITVPVGSWKLKYNCIAQLHSTAAGARNGGITLGGGATYLPLNTGAGQVSTKVPMLSQLPYQGAISDTIGLATGEHDLEMTTSDTFAIHGYIFSSSGAEEFILSYNNQRSVITAECTYV